MNKGFIAATTIVIVALATTVVAGGAFGLYKYNETIKEKEVIQAELLAQKEQEIERLQAEADSSSSQDEVSTSTESIEVAEEPGSEQVAEVETTPEPQIIETVRTVTEYVPVEVESYTNPEEEVMEEVAPEEITEPEPSEEPEPVAIVNDEALFEIGAVRQTAYPDGYGGVYGSYEVELLITAPDNYDVYIPQTTTNTIGASRIGFSYTVLGDNFQGVEDSQVSCSIRSSNNCKIKAGRTSDVVTTIWLYPDSESNGNYSLTFDDVEYMIDGEWRTFTIDRTTSRINLMY